MKVRNLPGSGKDIAKGKGVRREAESEGSRMANLWPDEQKPYIRLSLGIRPLRRLKSNSYTELAVVDAAGRWRERNVWYLGRSAQNAPKGATVTMRPR